MSTTTTTEPAVGDLVRAVKGETKVEGRVKRSRSGAPGFVGESNRSVEALLRQGYVVEVVEKAKPALPTEPGVYLDKDGDAWIIRRGSSKLSFVQERDSLDEVAAEDYAPFVKLSAPSTDVVDASEPSSGARYVLAEYSYSSGTGTGWGVLDRETGKVAPFGTRAMSERAVADLIGSRGAFQGTYYWDAQSRYRVLWTAA